MSFPHAFEGEKMAAALKRSDDAAPLAKVLAENAPMPKKEVQRNMVWSKLLGCEIVITRKVKVPATRVMCEEYGMWLREQGYAKTDRHHLVSAVLELLLKDGGVDEEAPLAESVRARVAAQRRSFLLGENTTESLIGETKLNNQAIKELAEEIHRLSSDLKKLKEREERRKRKQAAQLAQRLQQLAEDPDHEDPDPEVERGGAAQIDTLQLAKMVGTGDVRSAIKGGQSFYKADTSGAYKTTAAQMKKKNAAMGELVAVEEALAREVEQRRREEEAYARLLAFLDSLPPLDKHARPVSIKSVAEAAKLKRKKKSELAFIRIRQRAAIVRAAPSNHAFCGHHELMLLVGLLRSVRWVKCWMAWYNHLQHKRDLRDLGHRIGFGSAANLKGTMLGRLRRHVTQRKAARTKVAKAAAFMQTYATAAREAFRAWVELRELLAHVELRRTRTLLARSRDTGLRALHAWSRRIRNKTLSSQRARHSRHACAWRHWREEMEEKAAVRAEVEARCQRLARALGGASARTVLREWRILVHKKHRAMKRWREGAMFSAFGLWADACADSWALYAAVEEVCSSVLAALAGQSLQACLVGWRDVTEKNRRALQRWRQSTVVGAVQAWRQSVEEGQERRLLLKNIRKRFDLRWVRGMFFEYRQRVAHQVAQRRLLKRVCTLWDMRWVGAALRSMAAYALRRRVDKKRAAQALRRHTLRLTHTAWAELKANKAQRQRAKRAIGRARARPAERCFELWADLVEDTALAVQSAMAAKSTIIARFLKRAMVECYGAWAALSRERARERRVVEALGRRMRLESCVIALRAWGEWVEEEGVRRRAQVLDAVTHAVHGAQLASLQSTLHRHFSVRYVRER